MEKKLIALAIAGLASTAAFAQSNVTIYGMADYYIGHSSGNGKTLNTVGDGGYSPTRVGFKGTEDLGEGVKAIFLLEYWANNAADGNNGLVGTRQQYAGLSSNYGTLTAGYQYNPGADVYGINAPSTVVGVYSSNQIQTAIGNNGGNLRSLAGASRWANSVKYLSPTWAGFNFSVAYATGEIADDTTPSNNNLAHAKWGANARYANGPLGIDVAYVLQRDKLAVAAAERYDVKEWYIGGRYDFGVVKAFATYQTLRNDAQKIAAYDHNAWTLGLKVPVAGKHAVNLEYAQISYDPANGLANQANDGSSKSYSAGYEHNLSKRTMLYTAVAHTKNDSNIPTLTYWNTEKQPGDTAALPHTAGFGKNTNSFMLGMRHMF